MEKKHYFNRVLQLKDIVALSIGKEILYFRKNKINKGFLLFYLLETFVMVAFSQIPFLSAKYLPIILYML